VISLPNMLEASAVSGDPVTDLQLALGVELAVMPPYLYALWSIKPAAEGAGPAACEAARTIRGVVHEEMLHAALVGNILNALGKAPLVTSNLMTYPGPLPGHMKTGPYAYDVFLGPFSADAVDMFLRIENPHWPSLAAAAPGWTTLRELYDRVVAELRQRRSPFNGGRQVAAADSPSPGRMLPVTSLPSAIDAIAIILDQGEGLQPKPDDPDPSYKEDKDREVAHYYQFQTIRDYLSGDRVEAARDVYPVITNPDPDRYSLAQRVANDRFNQVYSALLDSLQAMFTSSSPTPFGRPTKLMGQLSHLAAVLRSLGPVPGTTDLAGPSFQYLAGSTP
jgi:Ferritin-like